MNEPTLAQRQTWFRFFPDGSIEFLLVTRVLLVVLLLALGAVQVAQRRMVLMALYGVLWFDYVLVIWWLVQVAADMRMLEAPADPPGESAPKRVRLAVLACLPAVALLILVAPWHGYVFSNPVTQASAKRVLAPVLIVVYLAMTPVALHALRKAKVGAATWVLLLLVPILHWFALHRLLVGLRDRLRQKAAELGEASDAEGHSLAIPLADTSWILSMLPWLVLIGVWLSRGVGGAGSGGAATGRMGALVDAAAIPCAAILAAVFSIANVAAIEGIQRQFNAVLRRIAPAAGGQGAGPRPH